MVQDRAQKQMALRYCVARRWFPQVEVTVSTYVTTNDTPHDITDVDVLASIPNEMLGYRTALFDCKTGKNEFWDEGTKLIVIGTPRARKMNKVFRRPIGVFIILTRLKRASI